MCRFVDGGFETGSADLAADSAKVQVQSEDFLERLLRVSIDIERFHTKPPRSEPLVPVEPLAPAAADLRPAAPLLPEPEPFLPAQNPIPSFPPSPAQPQSSPAIQQLSLMIANLSPDDLARMGLTRA